jgi:alpha-L-arabinofuranosidase
MIPIVLFALSILGPGTNAGYGEQIAELKNGGFESRQPLENWQVITYGPPASVALDADVMHNGAHSLRVSSDEPSDTALGQDIALAPSVWYRFSGWVKTRGLERIDAQVSGTFQVQRSADRSAIAAGESHQGDTPWTRVELVFQSPADGHVRIAPFLVGFGKGRGTAWFDEMAIERIEPNESPVVITREFLRPGRINPFQYGQFIEYLCTMVPAMWAEKLFDGSFEGLSPYKVAYLKETDFRERPWYPGGATNRARFERDRSTRVSGELSFKIASGGETPCTVSIAQDGIAVQAGVACDFGCFLKQSGLSGRVRVRLHHDSTVYASAELEATAEWGKQRARLVPTHTDANTTLTIEFRGPGTLWLDNASLMPLDARGGWRADVVEAVKAMHPGIIRFGGSTLDDPNLGEFEWRDTIGDPDHRRPFRAWGGLQPTGPGLEEFVEFCRMVDAEPLICVRFSRRDPKDAAELVQYLNGTTDTTMGALRAKNGHPQPYRVKFWQVGNERSGRDYEARLAAFCEAMKKADPSIELMSSYPTANVVERAGEWLNYVSPHHYECANLRAEEDSLNSVRKMIAEHAKGRPIAVAVTEWNTTGGDWGPTRGMLWSLANALACSRYHNLIHRHCDLVQIACRSNLVNSFCSGCIQTDNHRLYKTPTYYAQQLYATMAGDRPLRIDSPLPPTAGPDLSATLSAQGDAVIVFAVNDGLTPIARPLDFSAFADDGGQTHRLVVWTLSDLKGAGEPDATNTFADPERIISRKMVVIDPQSPRFTKWFPPLSLTVLRWEPRHD